MEKLIILLVSLCGFGATAYISELTDNNFFDYAKDKDILLVDFYAPWCSDCKKLDPEFDKAAQTLEARSLDLAKVDCFGSGQGLCQMYGVKSWPQLKTFRKGTYVGEYQGVQTGDSMALYVESLAGQPTEPAAAQAANTQNINQAPYSYAVPAGVPSTASEGAKGKTEKGSDIKTHAKAVIHKGKKKSVKKVKKLTKDKPKKEIKKLTKLAKVIKKIKTDAKAEKSKKITTTKVKTE